MTRLVSKHDQTHIRSPLSGQGGCTKIPRAAGRAQEDETILLHGALGHTQHRFVHLDRPGLIGSWRITGVVHSERQASFIVAPSITMPALTYFQSATRSFRASATIVVFRRRPPFCSTRSRNQRVSAECG